MKGLIFGIAVVLFTILLSVNFSYAVNRILALDRDGDYVEISDDSSLNFGADTDFSIVMWVKGNTMPTYRGMVFKGQVYHLEHPGYQLCFRGDGSPQYIRFDLRDDNDHMQRVDTFFDLDDNNWHQVAITCDRDGHAKSYIDGVYQTQADISMIGNIDNTDAFNIGSYFPDGGPAWDGLIDEASIWNRVLSQEEIQSIMSTTLQGDEEGLVGYWNFDNGTADDLSPFGNHGTLMNDAKIIPPINRALDFDGVGDYVEVSDASSLDVSDTMTLSAWIKLDELPSATLKYVKFISKDDVGVSRSFAFGFQNDDTLYVSYFSNNTTYTAEQANEAFVAGDVGVWKHVAVTITASSKTVKIYVDGILVDSTQIASDASSIQNSTADLLIGARKTFGAVELFFDGKIDEVSIWNRALTQMEIWAQKDAVLRGDEPGLVGYWRLDEEPGSPIAHDSSGNGNDGTVHGVDFVVSDAPLSTGALVSIQSVSGTKGETVNVPVIVESTTNILSLDLVLKFDENILTPNLAETTDLTTDWYIDSCGWQIDSCTTEPGTFQISIVNHSQAIEDGAMITIPFTVNLDAPPDCITTRITIEQVLLNEGHVPVTIFSDGIFSVTGRLGDVSLNGTITGYDAALVLQHTVQIFTLTDCQQHAADVNESGEITAYDAAMILQYVVGRIPSLPASFQSPAIPDITENDARIVLPYVDFGQNQPAVVPIEIQQKTHLVSSIELTLSYGNLKPIKVEKTDLTKGYALAYNIQNNQIKIALAGSEPLEQNGAFVQVEFEPSSQQVASQLRISHIRLNRNLLPSVIANSNIQIPQRTALLQNFPNPFNPETWIPYELAKEAEVVIQIYNIKGELVRTLSIGHNPAGSYLSREKSVFWNGKNQSGETVANGLYFYTLKAGEFQAARKMILVK
ncbi:T9SS type A sorting domain-containing protein [bacterium]|nr:T9SS type A sorting domain-containing protein [bacterium]